METLKKVTISEPFEQMLISARYIFRDDFDDLEQWNVIAGSPSLANSILTLPGSNTEIRSKRKFLYGILIIVAKSTAEGNLQIGFNDGGNDYVVWSGDNLRCKSTAEPTEGTSYVDVTETNYNTFVIVWRPDITLIWVNGSNKGPIYGPKIPNKPLPISIKNLGSGETLVDFVVVYSEPFPMELKYSIGWGWGSISVPIVPVGGLASGTSPIGYIRGVRERLKEAPWTDTTTPLGAGASFTGVSRDRLIDAANIEYYKRFVVRSLSDQAGTLCVDESPDNATWIQVKSVDVPANGIGEIVHECVYRYVRCRYVNGATAQTSFRLWSKLGTD